MESPHCPQCGFLKGGVFCDPILGCYNMKVEMMLEREGTSAGDDFDPLDYHGKEVKKVKRLKHAMKAKKERDPAASQTGAPDLETQ